MSDTNEVVPNSNAFLSEDFKEEISAIDNEIVEIESLYKDSKDHMIEVRNNSRKNGGLAFVHLQTSNLITMKNTKISLLKAKADLKKRRFDQEFKKITGNLDKDDKSTLSFDSLMNLIRGHVKNVKEVHVVHNEDESRAIDAELEASLDANNIDISTIKDHQLPDSVQEAEVAANEGIIENIESDEWTEIVCDRNGILYVLDNADSVLDKTKYGISESDRAVIEEDSESGIPKASFRGVEITIIEFE